jgi:hypothetical protein
VTAPDFDAMHAAQQERRDAERNREQDIIAADQDLLAAAKTLRAVELGGHWLDDEWWQVLYRLRDIADRVRELEENR